MATHKVSVDLTATEATALRAWLAVLPHAGPTFLGGGLNGEYWSAFAIAMCRLSSISKRKGCGLGMPARTFDVDAARWIVARVDTGVFMGFPVPRGVLGLAARFRSALRKRVKGRPRKTGDALIEALEHAREVAAGGHDQVRIKDFSRRSEDEAAWRARMDSLRLRGRSLLTE